MYELIMALKPAKKFAGRIQIVSKLKGLVLCLVVFLSMVTSDLQAQTVTLNQNNISIKQALFQIRKQTGYDALWQSGKINDEKTIDVKLTNSSLKDALTQILGPQNLGYEIEDKTIVIKQAEAPVAKAIVTKKEAQKLVRGTVRDSSGNPLAEATVLIKGTNVGTKTDKDGKFSFPNLDENTILLVSFTGFMPQEVAVDGQSDLQITLKVDANELEAVAIVAFGTQKKSTMIGAVTTVNPKELKGPTSNLTTMLAGRVAGVIGYQRSGEPGKDNAEFFIRGVTTFGSGKRDPLILIDGMESNTNDLARLQPDDIAGFSILKDATAAALYGARGANGVVLVSTKSGSQGRTRFNVRFENTLSTNTRNFAFTDNITYMKLANEAATTRDPRTSGPYDKKKIERTAAGDDPILYPNNNWIKQLIRDNTYNSRLNINIDGGGERARYYISGTYNIDNGILKNDAKNAFNNNVKSSNYEVRSNIDVNLTSTTTATVRTSARFNEYKGPTGGGATVFQQAIWSNPVQFPAIYPDTFYPEAKHPLFGNARNLQGGFYVNPYANLVSGYQEQNSSNVIVQLEMKQNFDFFLKGLSARLMTYTQRKSYFDLSRRFNPFYYAPDIDEDTNELIGLKVLNEETGREYLDFSPGGRSIESYVYGEAAVNYHQKFGEKHDVNGMLITILSNYLTPNVGSLQSSLPRRNQGVSGRFTYGYDDRYLTEFNFGYNGSERFSKANRYGFFPSIGVGWVVSNEPWFKPAIDVVSKLKLRATYGLVGNDQIGNIEDRFFYLSNIGLNDDGKGYAFGENYIRKPGVSIYRYENKEVTWEKAAKTNIGLEMGLFNALNLEVDIFREHRSNILMWREYIPSTMGLSAGIQANVGEAQGEGLDMTLTYNKVFNSDWWINTRGNFTYARSKLLVNEEPQYPDELYYKSKIGQSLSQSYGLVAERLFVDDYEVLNSPRQSLGKYSAGDIKYRDINGDGQITYSDVVPLGHPHVPEIVYGFGFSLGYKAFDFSAFFQGSARSSFFIYPSDIAPFLSANGYTNGLLQVIADDHWSEDNRNLYAFWPRLSDQHVDNNNMTSSWWMRSGNYLRLKQVEIGFNVPQKRLEKLKLSQLRVYVNSSNLFTMSNFKLWDVEMGGFGLGYPPQKVFNFGALIGF